MASMKLAMANAVQERWPLYRFDVNQEFVRVEMDTGV